MISKYCKNLAPEYRKRLEQMLMIDTAIKQKQQESQITEEEIGEVATSIGEMGGILPQEEIRELTDAIKDTVVKNENENDIPEQ